MLVGVECMFAAMLEQVTCMTMSPHMLHAHAHTHTQLAQHSTQLAQAYTCSPTTKVGKKTTTTITQLVTRLHSQHIQLQHHL